MAFDKKGPNSPKKKEGDFFPFGPSFEGGQALF